MSVHHFLAFLLGGFALFPSPVFAQMCGGSDGMLPHTPKTGRTEGSRQQLITRGEENCPSPTQPLTALTSPQASDYTFSAYPSFWFFIPFNQGEIEQLEFILYDESERKMIYTTKIQAPSQAGLIEVKLPQEAEYALKESETYRWYFFLDCKNSPSQQPDLEVNGWITRHPLTATVSEKIHSKQFLTTYLTYQNHRAWYDAVTYLAETLRHDPDQVNAQIVWENLLACLNLNWVAQAQFVEEAINLKPKHQAQFE